MRKRITYDIQRGNPPYYVWSNERSFHTLREVRKYLNSCKGYYRGSRLRIIKSTIEELKGIK